MSEAVTFKRMLTILEESFGGLPDVRTGHNNDGSGAGCGHGGV